MKNAATMTATTPTDREVAVTRVFDAPRQRVFKTWTNKEDLPHWMLGPPGWTMPVCEIDFRPGGAWRIVWRQSDGTEMEMRGTYREIVPPERIVSKESWGGNWPETVNTVTLAEKHGQTTMTMTILYPSKEARDAALQTGMTKGMAMSFDRLEKFLASQLAGEMKKRA